MLWAGDVAVQRARTIAGKTGQPRTFILVGGAFTAELLASLGDDVLGGPLHDPMEA